MSRSLVQFTSLALAFALVANPLASRLTAEPVAGIASPVPLVLAPKKSSSKLAPAAPTRMFLTERGGTYFTLRFMCNEGETPHMAISTVPLHTAKNAAGSWYIVNSDDVLDHQIDAPYLYKSFTFTDLAPNTEYFYAVLFYGNSGGAMPAVGSVRTRVRHVEITFDWIQMHDDSDDFGAGELAFRYQLFAPGVDYWQPNVSLDHVNDPPSGYLGIASGEHHLPNVSLFAAGVGEEIVVGISALEDDAPSHFGTNHEFDYFLGDGANDNYEWNSRVKTIPLSGLTLTTPGAAGGYAGMEELHTTFEIHVADTDATCLEYTLYGEVHMTYE
jgi:hypothetical protein